MSGTRRLAAALRNLLRRRAIDRDLDDELASYVELAAAEARERGESPASAARHARLQLGGTAAVADAVRSSRTGAGLERLWQDVRYAVRGLGRAPGYAAAAVVMLGLGIGANTAIFSIVDAAMFKPLPYTDPQQLVLIRQILRRGTAEQTFQIGMTWDQIDRWRREPQIFPAIATYIGQRMPVEGPQGPGQQYVSFVSPEMSALLGITPILGRSFVVGDAPSGSGVVLLAEDYWRSAFRGDPAVLGKTITIDSRTYSIVGVMPATLRWGVGGGQVAAWLPLDEASQRQPTGRTFVGAIARLRPGLTIERADVEMAHAIARTDAATPADRRYDADLMPLDTRGSYDDTNRTRRALAALLAAVGFVFLIACGNVTNLVLARVLARRREVAVRGALGATRLRLFRQFLTEGLVVVACGGACAIALAYLTVHAVPALVPEQLQLFDANPLILDRRACVFCGVALLVAAAICGLVPALRAVAGNVIVGLDGSPRIAGVSAGARRLRLALQAGQVMLTLVLLTGAGLLASSFVRMTSTRAGYDIDRLVSATVSLPKQRYASADARAVFLETLLSRIRSIPGVRATSAMSPANGFSGRLVAYGSETASPPNVSLSIYFVGPDHFAIAGIPLKSGRFFGDAEASAGETVGVIDEHAAALYWPGQSAIGQRFRYSPHAPWITVVGVVGHVKTRWFTYAGGTVQVYVPVRLNPLLPVHPPLLVRTEGDPDKTLGAIKAVASALDPAVEIQDAERVANAYEDIFREPRFFLALMTMFAGLALLTASVGLYGLVSYAVSQRTREIGVRLALGASPGGIRRLVIRDALIPVVIGLTGGTAASWWLSRFLSTLLYEITPHDSGTFAAVTMLLMIVALAAAYLPSRRAIRIDPVETLRAE